MMDDIYIYNNFKGESAHLMVYVHLLIKYLNYDLGNIFIAGTGRFDFKNNKVGSCAGLFAKILAAFNEEIRLFLFSREQKDDVENFINSIEKYYGKKEKDWIIVYYVDCIDDIKAVLDDIELKKNIFYDNNIFLKIKSKRLEKFTCIYNQTDLNHVFCKELIANKKLYGLTSGVVEEYKKIIDSQVIDIINKDNYEKIKSMNIIMNFYKIFFELKNYVLLLYLENAMKDILEENIFLKEYYQEGLKSIPWNENILFIV